MNIKTIYEEGNSHYLAGRYKEARSCYEKVLSKVKDDIIIWHNNGLACYQLGDYDAAIKSFEYPVAKEYAESLIGRGAAYRSSGKYKEALRDFAMAFVINPYHGVAYSNYANSLREFGKPDLAIPFLQTAIKLNDSDEQIKLNLAVCYLALGEFDKAWEYYDSRWYFNATSSYKPKLPGPEFDGTQDVKGKIVLIYGEQGFGDHIQFSRYISLVENLGAKVIFACRPQLVKFFAYNFPKAHVYQSTDSIPPYDYHAPLMSLPQALGTTLGTIPSPQQYLGVRPEAIKKWADKLGPKTKLRVGITWTGTKVAFITKFRRVPLTDMLKLNLPNVELVNVTYDVTAEEKKIMAENNIIDFSQDLTDFEDNAALIANLDLVVTVDTVTAHLAGALGIPTWVMLANYGCDWRWFLNRTDSPFYSCLKLFRQKEDNKWSTILDEISSVLSKLS